MATTYRLPAAGLRIVLDTAEAGSEQGDYAILVERRILQAVVERLRYVARVEIPEAMGDEGEPMGERMLATAEMLEQATADWWPTP